MDTMAALASIAKEHGGIVETKVAIAQGISKAMSISSNRSCSTWEKRF